jgi:hypothetical protein
LLRSTLASCHPSAHPRRELTRRGSILLTASTPGARKRAPPHPAAKTAYSKRIAHRGSWVKPVFLAKTEYRAK